MDTRTKILTAQQAVKVARDLAQAGRRLRAVSGYFDPLLAEHARRLAACRDAGGALMVVVGSPERPILPARARAELVAALAVVDYVVLAQDGLTELLARAGAVIERQEHFDEQIRQELIAHVHRRQHGA